MPRIKLPTLKKSIYSTQLEVRVEHINYGGHMGNEQFLIFAHEARLRFFHSINASELDFFGVGLIMTESVINYKKEVFRGDCLKVLIALDELTSSGFEIHYAFERIEDQQEVARVKTSMRYFDYNQRSLARAPHDFLKMFEQS